MTAADGGYPDLGISRFSGRGEHGASSAGS